MKRKPLCRSAEIPANGLKQFGDVCVINAGDRFFACQAACPHQGVALCEGSFDGETLTCLEHLWQWNLRQGGEPCGLAEEPLKMLEVEEEGGALFLKR